MKLDSETLKKRLRYQGQQYGNGQFARGGGREPHMLEQAADRIEALEQEIANCKDDFNYLMTITEDKDGLHDWLRMRLGRITAMAAPLETAEARNKDLLQRLGVQGHDGAVAEIGRLREAHGLEG